ncbi:DUF171-domain-containing protein [Neoconidiobolus thromboides FSU 785]|nr:DUF171-domain-containing protein [Neoconidiobolus thromboides FSU 785]
MMKKRRVTERIALSNANMIPLNSGEKKETILKGEPRKYTVSVAIPGSIVANAQSQELRTYLVGQIARALVVFNVDEVVVYNDNLSPIEAQNAYKEVASDLSGTFEPANNIQNPDLFMARVLQYLETPQYLRKQLFPIHKDLQFAGLLNPLDCPHHLRSSEISRFREGIILNKPIKQNKGSFAYCGLKKELSLDKSIKPGTRVTVEIDEQDRDFNAIKSSYIRGKVVSYKKPREEDGIYWGYQVRHASNLSNVFDQSPYKGGYDLKIGTSERGESIDSFHSKMPEFNHLIIVFGGVAGIEAAVDADQSLQIAGDEASSLFDFWINTCPSQGSRTIRTEEAILVTISALRPSIESKGKKV